MATLLRIAHRGTPNQQRRTQTTSSALDRTPALAQQTGQPGLCVLLNATLCPLRRRGVSLRARLGQNPERIHFRIACELPNCCGIVFRGNRSSQVDSRSSEYLSLCLVGNGTNCARVCSRQASAELERSLETDGERPITRETVADRPIDFVARVLCPAAQWRPRRLT